MGMQAVAIGERREFTRHEVAWHMRLLRESGERCEALCTDVGSSGVGFQTVTVLRAGEIIDLQFPGAGGDAQGPHPPVRAQIIYRIGDQYGASFLTLSD
jgi:hypothetical protein